MADMHRYEINLKQGDLFISLSSGDVYFISKQMDKWFKVLLDDSYVPVSIPPGLGGAAPEPSAPVAPPEAAPPPPAVEEEPPQAAEPPPPPPPVVQKTPAPEAPAPVPPPEAVEEPVLPPPRPEPAFVRPEPVMAAERPVMPPPKVLSETVEDDFEAVMDSLMKDLGDPVEEFADDPDEAPELEDYILPTAVKSLEENGHRAERVDFEMIHSLSELCGKSRAATAEDYLLLSAFYMTCIEGVERFSLKRINSMLVKSGLTPVNHSVLETALSRHHLEMVPDLTGMAEATEYTLTDTGMDATHQLL